MKLRFIYSIVFTILLTSHSSKAQDFQLSYAGPDILGNNAYFTRSVFFNGISGYLRDIFNAPSYAQDFLPNNFFHMTELLHHGNKTGKDRLYIRSVLRLFSNKIKASTYVNAFAFTELLGEFPHLLERYFIIDSDKSLDSLKDIIYEIQYRTFATQFPDFKSNPSTFLHNLSAEIEDATELRKLMMVFLEISLSKLIWSPNDQYDTWQTTKLIADQLTSLYKKTIIADLEDLNSLCISLLERYCFFLDVAGTTIEITTFEQIKEDIQSCCTPLLHLPEQEDIIETKIQRFSRCLLELEAKARAREVGLII